MNDLIGKIKNAGVVGAGGAGFPTHAKLMPGIETIIINAVECEPLLKVDIHILQKYKDTLFKTLEILLDTLGAKDAFIMIKEKNLYNLKLENNRIHIKTVGDFYPAGDEITLIYEAVGKIIPFSKPPIVCGVVVFNVETLLNISNALNDIPVTHSYLTIGGECEKSITVKAPIGMSFRSILGNLPQNTVCIEGGAMMGRIVDPDNTFVKKTTKGIIVLPSDHFIVRKKMNPVSRAMKRTSNCCACMRCTELCPRYLMGYDFQVHKFMHFRDGDDIRASICCECNLCSLTSCLQDVNPMVIVKSKKTREKPLDAPFHVRDERSSRLMPTSRLMMRTNLLDYVKDVEFQEEGLAADCIQISLSQNIGSVSRALCHIGKKVKRNEPIADFTGLGAFVHSSIDGIVTEITENAIMIQRQDGAGSHDVLRGKE